MGEMTQFLNMRVNTCHLIQFPSGKWGFVGKVPADLAYVDPTPEKLRAAKFGGQFGPKARVFDTAEGARKYASDNNYQFENSGQTQIINLSVSAEKKGGKS